MMRLLFSIVCCSICRLIFLVEISCNSILIMSLFFQVRREGIFLSLGMFMMRGMCCLGGIQLLKERLVLGWSSWWRIFL